MLSRPLIGEPYGVPLPITLATTLEETMAEEKEPILANMHEVIMQKHELLEALIKNKAKHDVVLATAISGYWEIAQDKMAKKRTQLAAQIEEWQGDVSRAFDKIDKQIEKKEQLPSTISLRAIHIDTSLGLVYPEDHSQDYERAIRMMQASVHDKVRLSVDEFDAYVMNNWEWKRNFIAANTMYVDSYRGKYGKMITGCASGWAGPQGDSGPIGVMGAVYSGAAMGFENKGLNDF